MIPLYAIDLFGLVAREGGHKADLVFLTMKTLFASQTFSLSMRILVKKPTYIPRASR